jgi:PKD repeat protein
MHKFTLIACLLLFQLQGFSQTNISGIINDYAVVSALDFCASTLTVNDATAFSAGDAILIIQMKGATINQSNSASFGNITGWGSAGLFERSTIASINNNVISLSTWLVNDYDLNFPLQLIRVPVYNNAIVSDTLRAKNWDGSTGGVLAFDVNGWLQIDAPIDVSGAGFRGGLSIAAATNNCSWLFNEDNYGYTADNWRGALKGEGIAIANADNVAGRGPQANGGGGGNDHNSGGGGGGHLGQGGIGGENDEPSNFGCDGSFPGIGGKALSSFNGERLFLGGGGGAGHSNNNVGSDGGNGGGILFIKANAISGSNAQLLANGNGAIINDGQDGAGGGGAGGTIWLQAAELSVDLVLEAKGFSGSQVNNQNGDRCFGPGGGGAGGAIYANLLNFNPLLSAFANGGAAGITTNSTNGCNDSTLGAMPGTNGLLFNNPLFPVGEGPVGPTSIVSQAQSSPSCEGDNVFYNIAATGLGLTYQWEWNGGSGFMPLTENAPYSGTQSNFLQIDNVMANMDGLQFRCVVNSTCGNEVQSEVVTLTIEEAPAVDFDFSASGLTVTFINQSMSSGIFTWDFGDGNSSTEVSPTHTYNSEGTYYVSLLLETDCGSSVLLDTVQLATLPVPGFNSDIAGGCLPVTVQFMDQTLAFVEVYAWTFPGGTPATSSEQNPIITYNEAGVFDVALAVTNNAGGSSLTFVNYITVLEEPSVAFDYQNNGLEVNFENLSQGANTYTWDFGDGSPLSTLENPTHDFPLPGIYIVTLTAANAFCSNSITMEIEIGTSSISTLQNGRWLLFPNPTAADLHLVNETYRGDLMYRLYDNTGRLVLKNVFAFDGQSSLATNTLVPGIYCLVLHAESGEEQVFKMIKL